jgi:hypothetical protein
MCFPLRWMSKTPSIKVSQAVVQWSRSQEFVVENLAVWPYLLRRSRKVNG